ncbi:hypothetical protein PaVLD_ORF026R [Planktothrix phage PaV-LD]|uniref:hypothetical protein n=1 Tax=Planktothrix phage PaV-LD TaxID=994601 RepID=UPI000243C89F|nr:hypothetical protein PaVLD_ORF026R [Planktothrix phage PaV-LD]ADZ31533.1 hypothetical protein PaVLD_ORF026R [Planktothrix phage PaV-LD]
MKVSRYAQELLAATCCHSVHLKKDGKTFVGIYNGFATWGRVENGEGKFVEELGVDADVEYFDDGSQCQNYFTEKSFNTEGGYEVIK